MIVSLIVNYLMIVLLLTVSIALYVRSVSLNRSVKEHEKKIHFLEQETQALLHADILFGKGLKELSQLIAQLDDRQEMIENQRNNDSAYQHALRILQMGGGVEDIIQDCHLSQAEADLLANIHAYHTVNNSTP